MLYQVQYGVWQSSYGWPSEITLYHTLGEDSASFSLSSSPSSSPNKARGVFIACHREEMAPATSLYNVRCPRLPTVVEKSHAG